MVRSNSFEFEGTQYKSLTAIARVFTGQKNINGFHFFGLIQRPHPPMPCQRNCRDRDAWPRLSCHGNSNYLLKVVCTGHSGKASFTATLFRRKGLLTSSSTSNNRTRASMEDTVRTLQGNQSLTLAQEFLNRFLEPLGMGECDSYFTGAIHQIQ